MEAGGEAWAGGWEVWEVEATVDDVLKLVGVIARGLDMLWGNHVIFCVLVAHNGSSYFLCLMLLVFVCVFLYALLCGAH